MSQLITTHFVQQFTTNLQLLSQQKVSRLRETVMTGSYVGDSGVVVDQYAPTSARRITTRNTPINPVEQSTDRRWVYPSDFDWDDLISSLDKLRTLTDPQSVTVQNANAAMNRSIDDEIIAAFFGTAKTGRSGGTSTTFPAAQQVSASEGASAATGMNVEKLKAGVQKLLAAEAWEPGQGSIYCGITAKQNRNLSDEIQVINADYNGEKAVMSAGGLIQEWGPIKFIHTERLPLNGSSQTRCPLWVKEGMHLGMWNDIKTDISVRKDIAGLPTQVYVLASFGATRVEEAKVIEIPCA